MLFNGKEMMLYVSIKYRPIIFKLALVQWWKVILKPCKVITVFIRIAP